jgi:ELWxxDGT repeat protein
MSCAVPPRAHRFRFESLERRLLLAVQLVADLNPASLGSEPENFTSDGATAWFVAKSSDNTLGLWRSDGTPAGTALVRGKLAVTTYPHALAAVGPRLYFANVDAEHGAELWTSDGTAAGTVFVEDLNPGTEFNSPINSEPSGFTPVGDPAAGRAVFSARGPDGRELFVTDGTPEGTHQVADLLPGPNNSWPFAFRRLGDAALFFADDPSGAGLWKTDGTVEGTTQLATLGPANSLSGFPFVAEGVMYFTAWSLADPTRRVIWRSDGTAAGTRPLLTPDAPPYYGIFDAASFANGAGLVWFAGLDAPGGSADLWRTDGTAAGTLKAIDLPQSVQQIGDLAYLGGGRLVWGAMDTASAQYQVWYSDGTQVGTRILKSFPQTNNSTAALSDFGFRSFGDKVLFVAYTPEQGRDFWLTDGTPAGTVPLDIDPGPGWGVTTNGFTEPRAAWAGSRLVFQGAGEPGDTEPWFSDGTAAGTRELVEINPAPAPSTISRPMVPLGGGILFDAGGKLLFTDGTPGNIVTLADMTLLNTNDTPAATTPHSSAVLPSGVTVFGVINADRTVRRVYRSDGTPQGTFALGNLDPSPGTLPSNLYWQTGAGPPFVAAGNFVYFVATDGTRGMELWKTDGTVAGTSIVNDIAPGAASAIQGFQNVPALAAVGDTVFFKAREDELWKTDGTEAGTLLVKDLGINSSGATAFHSFVAFGNKLLFEGGEGNLFASDGTEAGTVELLDRVEVVSPVVPVGPLAYFWGRDVFTNAVRLYRTDGTPTGTGRVGTFDGTPLETTPRFRPLVAYAGLLYFTAKTSPTGTELWKTDGTDAGTKLVADLRPGTADSRPSHLAVFDGRLYFFGDDGVHGRELWSTDGTGAGTRLEKDIFPGPTSSSTALTPIYPTPVATADELFFVAADDVVGRELWRATGNPTSGLAGRHLFYNDSAFDGFDAAANPADDGAIATDKAAMVPGQVATFANVSGYARGINGVMVDLFAVTTDLDADDFEFAVSDGSAGSTWSAAPAPLSVTERIPPALAAPTRVTLLWPDGAIRNQWLRVTVKANSDTRLSIPDVFYFGSLIGETGDNPPGGSWTVDAADVLRIRAAATPAATVTNPSDHNRDGRVNALDVAIARRNAGHVLTKLAVPIPAAPIAYSPPPPRRAPRPRSAWIDATG